MYSGDARVHLMCIHDNTTHTAGNGQSEWIETDMS